ncbi:hypothetical protein NNA33_09765, partial [Marisediminitalea aggregata]|uniref:hypothetical protein n=1 Tax=Marisediminitalea aggregata TaxID=634436 RepID=UPI0020CE4D45
GLFQPKITDFRRSAAREAGLRIKRASSPAPGHHSFLSFKKSLFNVSVGRIADTADYSSRKSQIFVVQPRAKRGCA